MIEIKCLCLLRTLMFVSDTLSVCLSVCLLHRCTASQTADKHITIFNTRWIVNVNVNVSQQNNFDDQLQFQARVQWLVANQCVLCEWACRLVLNSRWQVGGVWLVWRCRQWRLLECRPWHDVHLVMTQSQPSLCLLDLCTTPAHTYSTQCTHTRYTQLGVYDADTHLQYTHTHPVHSTGCVRPRHTPTVHTDTPGTLDWLCTTPAHTYSTHRHTHRNMSKRLSLKLSVHDGHCQDLDHHYTRLTDHWPLTTTSPAPAAERERVCVCVSSNWPFITL